MLSIFIFVLKKHFYLLPLSRGLHKSRCTGKYSWGSGFCTGL